MPGPRRERWREARAADILPAPYFHVVFTLPRAIAAIAFCNRRAVFDILFRTVAETLRTIAADLRVVPHAGFEADSGAWKTGNGAFLAPVRVLASLFRRRFLEELARAHGKGGIAFHGDIAHLADPGAFRATLAAARNRDWVVYAKKPFRGPEQVFRYLSRYTHRIAISESRITAFDGQTVSFRYRKPKEPGQKKPRYGTATVAADEFMRRFLLHVLPDGMHRIRHFGILANCCRASTVQRAREALGVIGSAGADEDRGEACDDREDPGIPTGFDRES